MSISQRMKCLFVSLFIAIVVGQAATQKQSAVTPVTGESWINHLHRALEETSMGKTGLLGPPSPQPVSAIAAQSASKTYRLASSTNDRTTVQGADLYRLNCRGCHGQSGLGAPPEISSVISPARATYAPFTMERLNKLGLETTRAQANELANQAKGALLDRLHNGGVDMPPFPQLSDTEARAIFAYLRLLAEVPGAQSQQVRIEETSVRIGEHIVKSTCHTCHNAAGVNPNPQELMQGAIPPLCTLTTRVSLPEFERKVRHGAPIMMGTPLLPYRGRMPVFEYLTESEVADAYLYLKMYPPSAWGDPSAPSDQTQSASASVSVASVPEPPQAPPTSNPPMVRQTSGRTLRVFGFVAEFIVALLLVGGGIFTVYEVKRSKPRVARLLGISGATLSAVPTQGGLAPVRRMPRDAHKQAAWRSGLHRTEHDLFEGSWFSRPLENEDGAA